VLIEGLEPASETPYQVLLDGSQVWPLEDSPYGPSSIRTPRADGSFRLTFGSCRRSAPFDQQGFKDFGPDALVALAEQMAGGESERPDAILLLGDQVYADDPSDAVLAKLRLRMVSGRDRRWLTRSATSRSNTWLYDDAWLNPAVRWLFSTVPLCMLLDDHDLRDDWNTSLSWRRWVTSQPWWHDRVIGAYASYWVYQHLGNLSRSNWRRTHVRRDASARGRGRAQFLSGRVRMGGRRGPVSTRWSYYRDFAPARRECGWSRSTRAAHGTSSRTSGRWWTRTNGNGSPAHDRRTQPINHLLLAIDAAVPARARPASLGGWNEAVSSGAWGPRAAHVGERIRRAWIWSTGHRSGSRSTT